MICGSQRIQHVAIEEIGRETFRGIEVVCIQVEVYWMDAGHDFPFSDFGFHNRWLGTHFGPGSRPAQRVRGSWLPRGQMGLIRKFWPANWSVPLAR